MFNHSAVKKKKGRKESKKVISSISPRARGNDRGNVYTTFAFELRVLRTRLVENHGEDPDFGKVYPIEDRARELYDISDSNPRDLQSVSMERRVLREEMTRISPLSLSPSLPKPYESYHLRDSKR